MTGRICRRCGNGIRGQWRPSEEDDWYEHWQHLLPEADEICDRPEPIPLPL